MDSFDFNAPQFIDFKTLDSDDEEAEKYFDFDHEAEDVYLPPSTKTELKNEEKCSPPRLPVTPKNYKTPKSRKTDCGLLVREFEGLIITTEIPKSHQMETRLDKIRKSPALALRNRSVLRVEDMINKEEENKNFISRKRKKSEKSDDCPDKYMCMAEAIIRFQKATPARFHSLPRNVKANFKAKDKIPMKNTIPVSPHLSVIHRNRPITAFSRKQLEEMEVKEMKKYQIKARPINKNVFKPPMDVSHTRQVTEVKAFNLTKFTRKKYEEPLPPVVKFTAQPIPKGLLKKTDLKNSSAPGLLKSNIDVPMRNRVPVTANKKEKENKIAPRPKRIGPITPKPFSFETRDKMLMEKKEKKIKEYLEEEKRAREFHANPLPTFSKPFKEKPTIMATIPQPFNLSSDVRGQAIKEKWQKKIEEENRLLKEAAHFKARPPTVLSQKPFIPDVPRQYSYEVYDISLNTESRAKERAVFDMKIKEKEEYREKLKMEREKELERRKEEEIAELRKKAVHKAQPVKHYKPVVIHPADKQLTHPLTPMTSKRSVSQ